MNQDIRKAIEGVRLLRRNEGTEKMLDAFTYAASVEPEGSAQMLLEACAMLDDDQVLMDRAGSLADQAAATIERLLVQRDVERASWDRERQELLADIEAAGRGQLDAPEPKRIVGVPVPQKDGTVEYFLRSVANSEPEGTATIW